MIFRHPEKVNNPVSPIKKKPNWIKTKITNTKNYFKTKEIINKKKSIPFARRLAVRIFQNAGAKNMQHL